MANYGTSFPIELRAESVVVPKDLLWERDPHTEAKHNLLARYLMAWFPIVTRYSRGGVTYADGFAGPGEYTNSTESSPAIAMAQARRTDVAGNGNPIRLLLLEKDKRRSDHLRSIFERDFGGTACPPNVTYVIVNGTCESDLLPKLTEIGAWGGPLFANLDGWGVDTPFDVVRRIATNKSSEVLVTFNDSFFTRFAGVEETTAGDRVYGDRTWRRVAGLPSDEKKSFLVSEYRGRLQSVGLDHTLTFEMVDEGGHTLFLIFGTSSLEGVTKMKDALWVVDTESGQRFRDPKDPNQMSFTMTNPNFTPLRLALIDQLKSGQQSLKTLSDYVLEETVYKASHVKPQVDELINSKVVVQVANGRSYAEKVYALTNHGEREDEPPTLFGSA